jgi:photosynthetic reaction center cytochrome c subunit
MRAGYRFRTRTALVAAAAAFAISLGARASLSAQQPPARQPPPAQPRAQQKPAAPAAPRGPLAPAKFKNIQVLKDLPADQLDGVMRFMSASLGVTCSFCHVTTPEGEWPMDKDDKRSKQTARRMIRMMRAINAQSFEGRPQVNCTTCHRGHQQPTRVPLLAVEFTPEELAQAAARAQAQQTSRAGSAGAPPAAPGGAQQGPPPEDSGGRGGPRPTESVDQVIDKYIDALGGRAAVAKVTSRVMRGTLTNRSGQSLALTVEEKAPSRYRLSIGTDTIHSFDGTSGWHQEGTQASKITIPYELQQLTRLADLGLATQMKTRYRPLTVAHYAKLDGKDVIIMQGRTAPTVIEQLFFDKDSGLLLRRMVSTRTAFGNLPEQIDYSDYRVVDGVKVPFQIHRAGWELAMTLKFSDIKLNVPVDDARFVRPTKPGH